MNVASSLKGRTLCARAESVCLPQGAGATLEEGSAEDDQGFGRAGGIPQIDVRNPFFLEMNMNVSMNFFVWVTVAASQPNIILIVNDEQGCGQLGCQGYPWLEMPRRRG
jgi:hypothetical protein